MAAQKPEYRDAPGASQVTEDLHPPLVQKTPHLLCRVSEVPDGGVLARDAEVAGVTESLIVLRRGSVVGVFLNICPHAGRRLDWSPGEFLLSGGHLICAAHGATFKVPGGDCMAGPCRGQTLSRVEFEVRDGDVWLAG